MKFLILFLFIFLFISPIYGIELGISPGNINFKGNASEKICQNISIHTDYQGKLIGEIKWVKDINLIKKIENYKSNSFEKGIEAEYSSIINVRKENIISEVCLKANKSGNYYGAIIYKTEGGYAGVGSWIEVNINKNKENIPDTSLITGYFGGMIEKQGMNNSLSLITIVIFIMLLIMLSVLLVIHRKLKKE